MWGLISGLLQGLYSRTVGRVVGGLARIAAGVPGAASDVWDAIQGLINDAISALTSILDALHSAIKGAWNLLVAGAGDLWNGLHEFFDAAYTALRWLVTVVLPQIFNRLQDAFSAIDNLGSNVLHYIGDQISSLAGRLDGTISELTNWIVDSIFNPLNRNLGALIGAFEDLWRFTHTLLDLPETLADHLLMPIIDLIFRKWREIARYAGRQVIGLIVNSILEFPEILEELLAPLL